MALAPKQSFRFSNLKKTFNKPNNRRKVNLIFDETKRKDYLTGFRKRKQLRRKKANDELTLKLKEEKKRIKQEVKNEYMLMSHRDIPELEELLSQKEYEADGRTVSILELNLNDLTRSSNWIGENTPTYDENSSGENLKNSDFSLLKSDDHESKVLLSKKELSSAVRKKTMQKTLESKVFQRKRNIERKKNKHISQAKKSLKLRTSKKNKQKNSARKT